MKDGSAHTGFIEKDGDEVELRIITGTVTKLPGAQIAKRATSHQSMMPANLVQTPDEMRHLLAYMLKKSGTVGSSPTLKPTVVHRFDPWQPNEFRFAAVEAQYVRVEILRGSKIPPCIDEIEVFAPGSEENLALQSSGAKASASSVIQGHEHKHQIAFLNDGKYGNDHSWIPAKSTGWAQVQLAKAAKDRPGRALPGSRQKTARPQPGLIRYHGFPRWGGVENRQESATDRLKERASKIGRSDSVR